MASVSVMIAAAIKISISDPKLDWGWTGLGFVSEAPRREQPGQ